MALDPADYASWSGLETAALIRQGRVSASEVMQAAIAACGRVNPALNAVIEVYADAAELRPAVSDGPFGGVPYLRKDIGASEPGRLCEMGSRLMAGHVSDSDTYFTRMVRDSGLVTFGRTTCPEFAMSSATESVQAGITRNPWDPARMAGGSSGGAAVAVASGMVAIAHGSDGGGSIRIPASACGVIGLKPSRGRVSLGPNHDDILFGLGAEFVLTRTMADTAAALDCLARRWPGEPYYIEAPSQSYSAWLETGCGTAKSDVRIAFTSSAWSPNPVAPDIAKASRGAAQTLNDLGFAVAEDAPTFDFDAVLRVLTICFLNGMAGLADARSADGLGPGPETMEAVTLEAYRLACSLSYRDLEETLVLANSVRRDIGQFFSDYDILVTPTLGQTPPEHGVYSQDQSGLDAFGFQTLLQRTDQFLPVFNVTGQPAITLPIGLDDQGMPIGVQLVARPGREDLLIWVAGQLEQAIGWNRRPPIHVGSHGNT